MPASVTPRIVLRRATMWPKRSSAGRPARTSCTNTDWPSTPTYVPGSVRHGASSSSSTSCASSAWIIARRSAATPAGSAEDGASSANRARQARSDASPRACPATERSSSRSAYVWIPSESAYTGLSRAKSARYARITTSNCAAVAATAPSPGSRTSTSASVNPNRFIASRIRRCSGRFLEVANVAVQRASTRGESGIRTHEPREGPAVFKTAAFNRSAISPAGSRCLSGSSAERSSSAQRREGFDDLHDLRVGDARADEVMVPFRRLAFRRRRRGGIRQPVAEVAALRSVALGLGLGGDQREPAWYERGREHPTADRAQARDARAIGGGVCRYRRHERHEHGDGEYSGHAANQPAAPGVSCLNVGRQK